MPSFGLPWLSWTACTMPASAASRPQIAKTAIFTRITGTPDSRAAFSLPPTAYRCRENALTRRKTTAAIATTAKIRTGIGTSPPKVRSPRMANDSGASFGPLP